MVEATDCCSSGDILQPLSPGELRSLRDLYGQHLPEEIHYYFMLKNQIDWTEKLAGWSDAEKVGLCVRSSTRYYVPRGSPKDSGTFVAITEDDDPNVCFHSLVESPEQLKRYLASTTRIHWKSRPVFWCISDLHTGILDELLKQENCDYNELSDCSYYLISKDAAVAFEYNVPSNVIMRQLEPSNAAIMNERWPHRYPNSEKYIRLLIQLNGGLGLFDNNTGDIVGWVLKNEFAGVGHLQILPEYRRFGFGEILAKAMTKRIALEDDGPVNAFIVDKNSGSIRLFLKLGFKKIGCSNWVRAEYKEPVVRSAE